MNENENLQTTGTGPQEPSLIKKIITFQFGLRTKRIILAVVTIAAVGTMVNSTIQFEARPKQDNNVQKPPPTYTGSAPLAINSMQEAMESNNDYILVITPCADEAINTSVIDMVVAAGNKIRTTDRIYVGVFLLPADDGLNYPMAFTRLMNQGPSRIYQYTFVRDITTDKIFDMYLSRKYLR